MQLRNVSRYERCYQKQLTKEGQSTQWPKEKGQTTIYKTLHRTLKIEDHTKIQGWTYCHNSLGFVSCHLINTTCATIEAGTAYPSQHLSGVRVTRPLDFCVMFCSSLFVLLFFIFWLLCCLFFFGIRILITSLWYLQALFIIILT
jgi:hypothetical protein